MGIIQRKIRCWVWIHWKMQKTHQKSSGPKTFAHSIKKQNLMFISNPMKSGRKMGFFTFITLCKSFRPITFLWTFLPFFNGFELSKKFCVWWYPHLIILYNVFLILAFLANFKAKIHCRTKRLKKHVLQMCPRIPFYIYLREAPFCQKKAKSLYPSVQCTLQFMWKHM